MKTAVSDEQTSSTRRVLGREGLGGSPCLRKSPWLPLHPGPARVHRPPRSCGGIGMVLDANPSPALSQAPILPGGEPQRQRGGSCPPSPASPARHLGLGALVPALWSSRRGLVGVQDALIISRCFSRRCQVNGVRTPNDCGINGRALKLMRFVDVIGSSLGRVPGSRRRHPAATPAEPSQFWGRTDTVGTIHPVLVTRCAAAPAQPHVLTVLAEPSKSCDPPRVW